MTDKELCVSTRKIDVRDAESKLREAQRNLENGLRNGRLKIQQAQSDASRDETKLFEEVERSKNFLEKEKAYLIAAEAELERGFEA